MLKNNGMSFISRAVAGISVALVVLLFSALMLSACNNSTSWQTQFISEEQAKEIVLSHAGVPAEEVSRYSLRKERDDRRNVYEIEFRQGKVEYDYELDAVTGEIIQFEKDIR